MRRMCVDGEEVSIGCSLLHTLVPELSARRESAFRKCWKAASSEEHTQSDEQHCWAVNSQFNAPVILRFPWHYYKFHRTET